MRGRPKKKSNWPKTFNFNPRPLAGATGKHPDKALTYEFQSTPPCGGDLYKEPVEMPAYHFNPRPLAGATPPACIPTYLNQDFNPRPLAGATLVFVILPIPVLISIHAPLRGRHLLERRAKRDALFQSTPPCGGDFISAGIIASPLISIHAPLRGRRIILVKNIRI